MSKHTPGPWLHDYDGDHRTRYVYVFDRTPAVEIARVDLAYSGSGILGEGKANFRLIAAAPDLLEALREAECALSLMHSYGHCSADSYTGVRDVAQVRAGNALETVSAAIAKATGSAQ